MTLAAWMIFLFRLIVVFFFLSWFIAPCQTSLKRCVVTDQHGRVVANLSATNDCYGGIPHRRSHLDSRFEGRRFAACIAFIQGIAQFELNRSDRFSLEKGLTFGGR